MGFISVIRLFRSRVTASAKRVILAIFVNIRKLLTFLNETLSERAAWDAAKHIQT